MRPGLWLFRRHYLESVFPAADKAVSIPVTLGSFGVSFLARPGGAIFLGAYGDRRGRKRALTLSILLMTIGTALMTVMPSYDSPSYYTMATALPQSGRAYRAP